MTDSLDVDLIYFYPKENSTPHKTDKYELIHDEENPIPILRRGLKFTIALRFALDRGYVEGEDIVKLIFSFGPTPNTIKGTKAVLRVRNDKADLENTKQWYVGFLSQSGDSVTLEVYAPPDCPVGIWNLQVETSRASSQDEPKSFEYENEIYILFNPWNSEDLVYMPDERYLDEYVLTDVGKIWVGPWGSSKGREWVFGQFDGNVLPAAMLMLERSELPITSRGDPILLTRCISKMVNSNDDDGILTGRWDGEYEDGTAPSAWTGSVEILQQFLETQQPVNYGQCWVFSGVATTICRALGIPSRVVSNLVSAHDANASLSVDKYYSENDEELDDDPHNPNGADSIWNYHVWSDVWMARPDLPKGYGGWQAIDATPQEASSGFYQCGPTSLEAIKQGAVGLNYDVAFMVASVNADLMRWKVDSKSDFGYTKIFCNKYHIGRMILTKHPWIFDPNGDQDRLNITEQYKAKEGTEGERLSLYNAVRGTELAKSFYALPERGMEDMHFELIELERVKIGKPFQVVVNVKNNSDEVRNVKVVLSAGSVYYNGVKAKVVKKEEGKLKMQPKSSEQVRMSVQPDDYLEKLVEYCILKLYAIGSVVETRQTWADEDDFQVVKPNLVIKVPQEIPVGKPTAITLRFINPLKKMLTKCKFRVGGSNLVRSQMVPYPNVVPDGLVKMDVLITPRSVGDTKIVATFSSKELIDITGSAKVEVYEADDE